MGDELVEEKGREVGFEFGKIEGKTLVDIEIGFFDGEMLMLGCEKGSEVGAIVGISVGCCMVGAIEG